MKNFQTIDLKGTLAKTIETLIERRTYVPSLLLKPAYETGKIDFLIQNPALQYDEEAAPYLRIAEIAVPAWKEEYESGTPSCTEDELYEKVSELSETACQSEEWEALLENYRTAFGLPSLEFEVGIEMNGFLYKPVYETVPDSETPEPTEDMLPHTNRQQAASQQYMQDQFGIAGQMDEQTRAAFEQQAQAGQQAMQAAFARMGIQMPEIPGMDMNALIQQAQANLQGAMPQMTPEMMAAYGMDSVDDDDDDDDDESWNINLAPKKQSLSGVQGELLAFGAPLFVYRGEFVNTLASGEEKETLEEGLSDWWDVTDRDSAIQTLSWLLEEGHRKKADYILDVIRKHPWYQCREYLAEHAANEEEADELIAKYYDIKKMQRFLLQEGIFQAEELPASIAGWDYVRAVSVGRWCYECGYITEAELWNLAEQVKNNARQVFSSWIAYGMSFAFGRGVWRGEEDDCATGLELTETLVNDTDSPWLKYKW